MTPFDEFLLSSWLMYAWNLNVNWKNLYQQLHRTESHIDKATPLPASYLPTFESAVGGDDPPNWIAVGVIARGDLFLIHLYFLNNFEAYTSDS